MNTRTVGILALVALSTACGTTMHPSTTTAATLELEIRQAERSLELALSSPNPTEWVEHYTEDAVFVAPGAPAVQGRDALTRMAQSMRPLSAVQIQALRTELSEKVAAVYARASWVSGAGSPAQSATNVRAIIVWRKGNDGRWRVAQELLHAEPPTR